MARTQKELAAFWAALERLGTKQKETKGKMISELTKGRTVSINDLTEVEYKKLMVFIDNEVQYLEASKNKMRRKIFAICHELKLYANAAGAEAGKICPARLKGLVRQLSPIGEQDINKHDIEQLRSLVTIFKKYQKEQLDKQLRLSKYFAQKT